MAIRANISIYIYIYILGFFVQDLPQGRPASRPSGRSPRRPTINRLPTLVGWRATLVDECGNPFVGRGVLATLIHALGPVP